MKIKLQSIAHTFQSIPQPIDALLLQSIAKDEPWPIDSHVTNCKQSIPTLTNQLVLVELDHQVFLHEWHMFYLSTDPKCL